MIGIILGIVSSLCVIGAIIWVCYAFKTKPTDYLSEQGKKKRKKQQLTQRILSTTFGCVSLILFLCVPFGIKIVDANQVAVVKEWGIAKEIKTSGTYFANWLSTSYIYYPTSVQQIDNEINAYSQDAQAMRAVLVVQYRINAEKAINITKEYGDNEALKLRIQSLAEERAKSVLSKKQAMSIIETRSQLSAEIIAEMNGVFEKYYIEIVNVLINDIAFSDAFEQAVENKMIAEQEQLKAEYEKQKKITEAEALLEVAKKEAEASIEKSKGDAEALKIMQQAWDSLSSDVKQAMLQQMAIEKWNGEMPDTLVGTEFLEWLMGKLSTP